MVPEQLLSKLGNFSASILVRQKTALICSEWE